MGYSYQLKTLQEYEAAYKKSVEQPEEFWSSIAANFHWKKKMEQGSRLEF
jgi:acetyl-CoA synthetase